MIRIPRILNAPEPNFVTSAWVQGCLTGVPRFYSTSYGTESMEGSRAASIRLRPPSAQLSG